jgi:hypothetical protein
MQPFQGTVPSAFSALAGTATCSVVSAAAGVLAFSRLQDVRSKGAITDATAAMPAKMVAVDVWPMALSLARGR